MSSVTRIVVGAAIIGSAFIPGVGPGVALALKSLGAGFLTGGLSELIAGRPKVTPPVLTGNVRGSSESHLVVFGERRVGGKMVMLGTTGDNNRLLYLGVAHSICHAGGCEGLQGFWFNDLFVPLASLGALDGSTDVSLAPLAGQVNLAFYRGTNTQNADPQSVAAGIDLSTDVRRRICWTRAILRMSTNADTFNAAFPGGIPTLNALLRGWRCYDPRLDSTAGGSGTHRVANPLTWAWTRNPALCASTYYIAPVQDGGCGEPADAVDWASVAVAANICDENLTTPAGVIPRYRCDIVLDTADARGDNLQKILDCMAGSAPWVGRVRKFYAGAYRSPTVTIDPSWLRDELTCAPLQAIDNLVNSLSSTFPDETQGFKSVDTPKFTLAAAVTADGGELPGQATYEGVCNPYRAQYLNHVNLNRQRRQETLELPVNLKGLNVESEENAQVTIPELGINGVYRVTQWRWDDEGFPRLRLKADAPGDYTPATFTVPPTPGAVVTGGSTPIGVPQALTAAGITGAVVLNWRSPAGTTVADPLVPVYLLERTFEDENTWVEIARVPSFSYTDSTVTPTDTFSYRVRAVNQRGQAGGPSTIATAGALQASGPVATAVQNPGFEEGAAGWAFGAGWSVVQRVLVGGGRFGTIEKRARTGLWSAHHTGAVSTALNIGFVAVTPGQRVTAQAWFAREDGGVSGSGFARLNWYDIAGVALTSVNGPSVIGAVPGGGSSLIPQWQASTVTLAVAPASAAFARLEVSATGAIKVDDGSLVVSSITSLDDVPDSASFARVNSAELTSGVPKLSIAGARTLPPRNVPAVRHAGVGSIWSGLSITSTYDSASPANVTISASAATLNGGGFTSSFSASSDTVTQARGTTVTWRLYYEGSNVLGGGTFALVASSNDLDLVGGANRAFVGRVTVTVPGSGSGSGGGGTPGGGGVIP